MIVKRKQFDHWRLSSCCSKLSLIIKRKQFDHRLLSSCCSKLSLIVKRKQFDHRMLSSNQETQTDIRRGLQSTTKAGKVKQIKPFLVFNRNLSWFERFRECFFFVKLKLCIFVDSGFSLHETLFIANRNLVVGEFFNQS